MKSIRRPSTRLETGFLDDLGFSNGLSHPHPGFVEGANICRV